VVLDSSNVAGLVCRAGSGISGNILSPGTATEIKSLQVWIDLRFKGLLLLDSANQVANHFFLDHVRREGYGMPQEFKTIFINQ